MNLKDITDLHNLLIKQILDKNIHKQCESIAKKFGRYYLSNWGTDGGEFNHRLIVNDLDIHFQTWVNDNNFMEITILNKSTNKMLFGYRSVDDL